MNKAGFTGYLDMEEALSEIGASDEFTDAVLKIIDEVPIQYNFTFSDYRPATRIDPEEPIEIEFDVDADVESARIITDLVRKLPLKFIMQNDELHKLWKQIEVMIEMYMLNDGEEKAYEVAWDYKQDREAAKADYRLDEMKERRWMDGN